MHIKNGQRWQIAIHSRQSEEADGNPLSFREHQAPIEELQALEL